MRDMKKNNLIDGISNYCDRWCERCLFTQRCEIFLNDSALSDAQRDPEKPEFWDNLSQTFADNIEKLLQLAEQHGIELDLEPTETTQKTTQKIQQKIAKQTHIAEKKISPNQHLEQLSRRYATDSEAFFNRNEAFFLEIEQDLLKKVALELQIDETALLHLKDAMEVIEWYRFFIAAKVHRALSGLTWVNDFTYDIDPVQNDSNGSAKAALLAIEKSLAAWETVCRFFPEKTDDLLRILASLSRQHRLVLQIFPNAKRFTRPGFDPK